jgi:hypothetical protein
MATQINMKHKETGLTKNGFIGFSWTTFFWGFFPALFRGDFMTALVLFVILVALMAFTAGIGNIIVCVIWAFMYNKHYTSKLIEKGYVFSDTDEKNAEAMGAIGLSAS